MMPFINKLLSSRNSNSNRTIDSRAPASSDIAANNRYGLRFGADQVRILLFRECEWRGRKLLFDSVTAGRQNGAKGQRTSHESAGGCLRSGNGLPQENGREACDNVSLLSELIFGTVAMTYRGSLFKIHTLDSPRCIMCTKVFPAPEHNNNDKANETSPSPNNVLSFPGSDSSLRKNSTSSSTCSGWDIELSRFESSQSLESSSTSSGFGSYSSLPRRWLRAVSSSLNHTESDELLGFQHCTESSGDSAFSLDSAKRRHKTRLGLSIIIKLTPGQEKLMEIRLMEHAAQLEALLNRLCYICIEKNCDRRNRGKLFMERFCKASMRCTTWLIRLLIDSESKSSPSIWHEILLNSAMCIEVQTIFLYRCFQQMSQLLSAIDTKSTNFFLSTVVTAILTYHLGWVNTVMSSNERVLVDSIKKKFPCNPLWAQLGDLYGTLGNPSKLVHTVVAGKSDKSTVINSILLFLSYFIRSAIVEKHYETRESPEADVQDAIKIVEQKKKFLNTSKFVNSKKNYKANEPCSSIESKKVDNKKEQELFYTGKCKVVSNVNIPKLKKSTSVNQQLDKKISTVEKSELVEKLDDKDYRGGGDDEDDDDDDDDDDDESLKKNKNPSSIKIFVNDEKNIQYEHEYEQKYNCTDAEMLSIATKLSTLNGLEGDEGPEATKSYASGLADEPEVYFSQIEYNHDNRDKQNQVLFTLGVDEKADDPSSAEIPSSYSCQCSIALTRVPSTSAQLPDNVLRKILQRNFPESSKSIQRPAGVLLGRERSFGSCPRCSGRGGKLLLETPTNATEVLRICGNSVGPRGARLRRVDSLELLKANNIIEVPMPRSKKMPEAEKKNCRIAGLTSTLLQSQISNSDKNTMKTVSEFTSGLVIQGLIKNNENNKIDGKSERRKNVDSENNSWLDELREEVKINARFPMVDQSVSEALCILADTDTWQVGILSNNRSSQDGLMPVGMSKLVSDMLEAFDYLWTKYHSPVHCLNVLEFKLREMWLRSEALADFLMTIDVCDVNLTNLTAALDLDAADVPLLLAVATTHSPQIAQRIGLSFT